jgi:hypothetical protein
MIAALAAKPQLITRRLGNLAAIRNPDVQAVIWSRTLPREARMEVATAAAAAREPLEFFTLSHDPFDRIQQQLHRAGVRSRFLSCDVALLVTVFGEILGLERVRVRLGGGSDATAPAFRLVAAYETQRPARTATPRFSSYAALFRGGWSQDHPLASPGSGLQLVLDPAPYSQPSLYALSR